MNIADVPVSRSSHRVPTPKSAGVAISTGILLGFGLLGLFADLGQLQGKPFLTFVLLVLAILLFALRDDLRPEPLPRKLAVQTVCALVFGWFVADVPSLVLPGLGVVWLGEWGAVAAAAWILFFMNAFNFMDGLNGLASGAAIVAASAFGLLAYFSGNELVWAAAVCVTAATTGFFVFNFPNGRIFMGETGSQVLGFVLAGLAVIAARGESAPISIFVLPVLFYPFLFDVVLTLVRRLFRGDNIFQGHREHLYQLLNQAGLSHLQVTLLYLALVAGCVVPAYFVQSAPAEAQLPIAIAPLPVIVLLSAAGFAFIRGDTPHRVQAIRFRRADALD